VEVANAPVQVQQPVTPAQRLLQILPMQLELVVEHPKNDKDEEIMDN